ncbi:hypothetical protein [Zhouia amylolytica]|uniref:Uncharacterized protein n=1 Tax=Zhouia amylolytica AD3 TaxID=1286632 RepID=W2UR28_9FLAO|nr:hypothetical protein [Zhouia amylolytica]ETN96399.1 hypothetical protein P278_06670 [Zhouia amylolytica AD3]
MAKSDFFVILVCCYAYASLENAWGSLEKDPHTVMRLLHSAMGLLLITVEYHIM